MDESSPSALYCIRQQAVSQLFHTFVSDLIIVQDEMRCYLLYRSTDVFGEAMA